MKDTPGLNTRGSDNRGDQGRTGLEFREEQMFGEDRGSMEFGWMRGSVRDKWIRSKGNTKGGNNRVGMIRVNWRYWKGLEGKTGTGLNSMKLARQVGVCIELADQV